MFQSLSFQKVTRCVTAVDSQITVEQGIMINVIGQLQVNNFFRHFFSYVKLISIIKIFEDRQRSASLIHANVLFTIRKWYLVYIKRIVPTSGP